jgi:hypothetical protein
VRKPRRPMIPTAGRANDRGSTRSRPASLLRARAPRQALVEARFREATGREVNPPNERSNHPLPANTLSLLKSNSRTNGETLSLWGLLLETSCIQGGLYGTCICLASGHRQMRRPPSVRHELPIARTHASFRFATTPRSDYAESRALSMTPSWVARAAETQQRRAGLASCRRRSRVHAILNIIRKTTHTSPVLIGPQSVHAS